MSNNSLLRTAVRRSLVTSAATAAAISMVPAQAQDDTIQEVVVTGSRISVPNMESISPVTAIGAEDIAATGKVRIEDILNQLPQAFAAQGGTISNGSPALPHNSRNVSIVPERLRPKQKLSPSTRPLAPSRVWMTS